MKKSNLTGLIVVALCLIFAIVISLYHIKGSDALRRVWIFADNGLPLILSLYVSYLSVGFVKIFFRWVLPPYFIAKLVYHLSCVVGVYLLPPDTWEWVWSTFVVTMLLSGLIYCLMLYKSRNE
jgi:hypothetical protein